MPLTIETGLGVAGANSYSTVAEARAYAAERGLVLPTTDAAVETALILAADKLEEYKYKGEKVSEENPLEWPRSGVYLGSSETPISESSIPARIKLAQCQLAYDATQTNLQPTGTGQEVIVKKVDVLETHFAPKGSGSVVPEFNKAEAFLKPFLYNGGSLNLSSIRV